MKRSLLSRRLHAGVSDAPTASPLSRRREAGLSLIETMVGLAVGLFIVGGAVKLFVDNMDSNRRLLVETRVNQDLRAAADLIARDLRRSGYWQNALSASPAASNPYSATSPSGAASASQVTYSLSRDDPGAENDILDANEMLGFRLNNNAIDMRVGTWQQLTDPSSVIVTEFTVTPVVREVPLGQFCTPACAASAPGCPTLKVRRFDIVLRGRAPGDSNVTREISESVRLRNDELPTIPCPP